MYKYALFFARARICFIELAFENITHAVLHTADITNRQKDAWTETATVDRARNMISNWLVRGAQREEYKRRYQKRNLVCRLTELYSPFVSRARHGDTSFVHTELSLRPSEMNPARAQRPDVINAISFCNFTAPTYHVTCPPTRNLKRTPKACAAYSRALYPSFLWAFEWTPSSSGPSPTAVGDSVTAPSVTVEMRDAWGKRSDESTRIRRTWYGHTSARTKFSCGEKEQSVIRVKNLIMILHECFHVFL